MDQCITKMEAQGKELNPETCVFVKKCPEGQVRNEKGRCVKTKKAEPIVNVQPFTMNEAPKKAKRVIPGQVPGKKTIRFNRRKPTVHNLNNETEKRGPPGPRLRKTGKLYKKPPANSNYKSAWQFGLTETRNSLNLENQKRGRVVIPAVRKTHAKKSEKNEDAYGISPPSGSEWSEGSGALRQNANNNVGLVFNVEHGGKPKLLRKLPGNRTPSPGPSPNENQLIGMYEAQQPPVNTRRLQRRKAKNKAAKAAKAATTTLSQNAAIAAKAGLAI